MSNCSVVILAAGEGTRMRSALPKVLHMAAGIPMVERVVRAAEEAAGQRVIVVYGSGGDIVPKTLGDRCDYALQAERKGSGHAVMMAADAIRECGSEYVAILAGDMPLIRAESIKQLIDAASEGEYGGMLLTGYLDDPTGYGRIVRDADGNVLKIVEQVDATEEEKQIKEVNISIYCFRADALLESFKELKPNNRKNEYYLTDCIEIIRGMGYRFGGIPLNDMSECEGVNDRTQLAKATQVLYRRNAEKHMKNGIELIDPDNTYIGDDVEIGRDTLIYPNVVIEGDTQIGENVLIYPNTRICDAEIGAGCVIEQSVIEGVEIPEGSVVGPFCHVEA
ncbi:MAG: NTP transferase domain-containing protein [Christensenellaceae bacterium]|nr:NTP transferase domain-containing protein [Christensenellaceae bacterium]